MAAEEREYSAALKAQLNESGKRFNFFQAVSLLHELNHEAVPVGELGPVEREAVHFSNTLALTFAASDVAKVVVSDGDGPSRVVSSFFGLTGAASPLSNFLCEEALRASLDDEQSLPAFYDLLHHRLLSLFYRSWRKYRFAKSFSADGYDIGTRRLLAFVGLDAQSSGDWHALPPLLQLSLAPVLLQRTRSASTLQVVLERLFPRTPFRIECFVARHAEIDSADRVALGVRRTELNTNLTIGRRVVDRSGRFRVTAGPVDRETFDAFMPGGRNYSALRRVLEQFTRGVLEAELEVELKSAAMAGFTLGSPTGASLGVDTQLSGSGSGGRPTRMRVLLSDSIEAARPRLVSDAA